MGRRTKKHHNVRNLKPKDKKKKKKSLRLKHILIAIVVMLVAVLALVKFNQGSGANITGQVNDFEVDEIIKADSANITLVEENGYVLGPNYKEPTKGIIINVDKGVAPKAYVPLAVLLAKKGYQVIIPSFILGAPSKDDKVITDIIKKYQNIGVWAIIGHGDGGIAMSNSLESDDKIKGAVFLASYPDEKVDLSKTYLKVISISGTSDYRMDKFIYQSRKSKLPANTMYVQLEKGNYENFANYTEDQEGLLTKKEQQIQTSVQILNLMDQLR